MNMADGGTGEFDTTYSEVEELFRKGLPKDDAARKQSPPNDHDCPKHGIALYYEKISEEDATVLRQMLSTGPAVRKLYISKMSLAAFRTAFDELEVSSKLENVYFGVDCQREDFSINLSVAFGRLWSLELSCHNVGSGFAKELARYIQESESLTKMVIWDSCGGDKGAAIIIKALRKNRTLKKFTLAEMELSPDMLITFAEMLATNSTLKQLDVRTACSVKKDKVSWLLQRNRYADVFKRLDITWPEQLLPELAVLVRSQACCSELAVSVASIVDDEALRKFSEAVATDTKIRDLCVYFVKATDDGTGSALEDTLKKRHDAVDEREDRDGAIEDTVDALCDGIAPGKRMRIHRDISSNKRVKHDNQRQLVGILGAVKKNRSIRKFAISTELVTPEMATSLSELLAVNQTLTHVQVCIIQEISSNDADTIRRGLRKNSTLTHFNVSSEENESVTNLKR
ncbi:hypothetical protein HPB52_004655 [Rhipicephalus sanguineus]|uniref:Uncharacterized protein n=1 Tax=Rhipicephalus sanguineus TaxID=34632 RepID=A0A9D4QDB9_RHISA|nr:hypothetical protein HPB52_004655 [Rhipicephalus sanguineus]